MENKLPTSPKKIHKYVLVSIALVQSEIFWFYSVLFCLFRESGLLIEQSSAKTTKRNRSHSEPAPFQPVVTSNHAVEMKEKVVDDAIVVQRRFSLPIDTIEIRGRPSIRDEQTGATCPPIYWQKLRVKLGRAPVYGDRKPKSIISSSPSTSTITPPSSVLQIVRSNTIQTNSVCSKTPSISSSSSIVEVDYNTPYSASSSIIEEFIDTASVNSLKPITKRKKIMTKINSAFHLRRVRSSNDL